MNVEDWQQIFTNIGSLVMGLVLAIGQLSILWKMKKAEHKKHYGVAIKEQNKYAVKIQSRIENLRESLDADRIQILEFHNGTDFTTRKGYKMDCTYEALKFGNASVKNTMQNYPTTMLPVFTDIMVENKTYFVDNIADISKDDMSTYAMKVNMHVTAFYDSLLENDNEEPIGILAVQYKNHHTLTEIEKTKIEAAKIIIQELIKQ